MNVPLTWLKEFVDVDLSLEELALVLTNAGLEVEEVHVVGLPLPVNDQKEFKFTGLPWDRQRIVVAQIDEVMPHPNADRLTLCRLQDGEREHVVLTGAPNLFPYKGLGLLPQPLKVAYAKEGATLYDGHQPGLVLTTLKRTKIRGVESYSMVCSEKELGISEEHEGIMFLDPQAPTGMPLADYMGDAVFEISILPNMIRNACVMGVARELAALTGKTLKQQTLSLPTDGPSIDGRAFIQITDASLNPRFVVGLVEGVTPQPSPHWVQQRLRLAGMRPINSIVDATNYVMLETGQPLHAFDYDVLVQRAGGKVPTIITRPAVPGEKLTTLDDVERTLEAFTILVTDTAGALSMAGVMGGQESEVTDATRNVLLEGATWNYVNVRRTVTSHRLNSEAGYRFSRSIHPALALLGVEIGMQRMAEWSGGKIAAGLVDNYPQPQMDPIVTVTPADVRRWLGIELSLSEMMQHLMRLEFTCQVQDDTLAVQAPPHRMDIGEGIIGKADIMEELARMVGYDNIPATRLEEELPPQAGNPDVEGEESLRDLLVSLGLQEVMTYRQTSPEREARLLPPGAEPQEPDYIRLVNPIAPDRNVMRRSLLSSVMEIMERNARLRERLAFFEIGPVFLPKAGQQLPDEPRRLVITLTGQRHPAHWEKNAPGVMDFFDLKGMLEAVLDALHITAVSYERVEGSIFHPGKCAVLKINGQAVGVFGELHPLVKERYDLGAAPLLAADLDLDALLAAQVQNYEVLSPATFPPVLEDIAVVVDETITAEQVLTLIRQSGGKLLKSARLFDIFRSEQIGEGKKSLAYSLTYQAPDRTLVDTDAEQIRKRIIRRLEQELGAKLRS